MQSIAVFIADVQLDRINRASDYTLHPQKRLERPLSAVAIALFCSVSPYGTLLLIA